MKKLLYPVLLLWGIAATAQNKVYPYSDGKKWGLTNSRLEVIISPQFDGSFYFSDDSIALVKKDKKAGVINLKGQSVIPCKYDDIQVIGRGTCAGRQNNKYVLLNIKTGKQLLPVAYDRINDFCYCKQNIYVVTEAGKKGFVNATSGKTIGKIMYDEAYYLQDFELRGRVKTGDKAGVMDLKTGALLIPVKYDDIETKYKNDKLVIVATLAGKSEMFDENGKSIPAAAKNIQPEEETAIASMNVEGVADEAIVAAEDGGDGGLYNTSIHFYSQGNGNWKLAFERRRGGGTEIAKTIELKGYDKLTELVYNPYNRPPVVKIKAMKNGKAGIIDETGNELFPFIYDNIEYRSGGFYVITGGNLIGVLNDRLAVIKKPVLKQVISREHLFNAWLVEMPGGQKGYMDWASGKIFIPGITE